MKAIIFILFFLFPANRRPGWNALIPFRQKKEKEKQMTASFFLQNRKSKLESKICFVAKCKKEKRKMGSFFHFSFLSDELYLALNFITSSRGLPAKTPPTPPPTELVH